MIKKILIISLLIISSFSCVYAYTFDEFVDFCNENYNLCSSNCKNQIDWLNSNKGTILSTFNSTDDIDDYDGFFLMGQNGYRLYLVAFKNTTRWFANANQLSVYGGQYTDIIKYNGNSMYKGNIYTISSSGFNISNQQASIGLMSIDAEDDKYGNMISNNYYINGLEFEPNYFQKVNFTGINDEFNALKYDYSITDWKLGIFEEIPEDVNKIVVTLFFADGGTAFSDSFLSYTKLFNKNYFFINNDNLYVHSRYIKYNTKYNLLMYTYDDSNNFIESYQYNYVFYPTNALIQNGSVVNPGSGDYSVQDSTNDTIAALTDSSDIDSILNLTFSGDYASFADDFGFLPFDNPFSTFLLHIVESLYDALTVRGNASLSANYRNYFTFSINSDDFRSDYQYKEFISAMLVFIYLYYNFIFFNHLITLVEIGNIEDAIDFLGFDEFYDSNMM